MEKKSLSVFFDVNQLTDHTGLAFLHISAAVANTPVAPIGVGTQSRIDTHHLPGLALVQIYQTETHWITLQQPLLFLIKCFQFR